MLTYAPSHEGSVATSDIDVSTAASPTGNPLNLSISFSGRVAVLRAEGELDMATTPRLSELLWPRLMTKLSAIVLDFSDLRFLGVPGLELLSCAHTYGKHRGIVVSVVNGSRAVDRALRASGLESILPCFDTVSEARAVASVL